MFDGKALYVEIFTITDPPPVNDHFELMGIEGKNFLINSGSFFIFFVGIIAFHAIQKILSWIAKYNSHREKFRKLGMVVHSKSYIKVIITELFKLFIESYFDIAICVALHCLALAEVDAQNNLIAKIFFSNVTDGCITVLCLVFTVLVFASPVYCEILIR